MSRTFYALALLVFTQPATAAPLSEEEAVTRALGHDAFSTSMEAEYAAAIATAAGAGAWANPQIQWSREQLRRSGASEDTVILSQDLDISGRLGLESDAAGHEARVVNERQRQVWVRRVAAVRRAFFSVLFEQQRNDLLQQWRQRLAELAGAVRARADAGDAAEYEARRLEAQLSRVDASRVIAATKRRSVWTELVILMGDDAGSDTHWPRVAGALTPMRPVESEGSTVQSISRRGDVAALEAERAAASARGRAAGRWWVPRLNLQGGYKGVGGAAADEHGVVIGVGLALPVLDRAQGEEEAQAAIARRAAARQEALTWAATQRIRERRSALVELVGAVEAMRNGVAVNAEKLARTAQHSYLAGEMSIVELLDAHQNALESQLELLDLQLRARMARIDLERETGVVL